MGYSSQSFAVSLEEVRNIFGSRNKALFKKIQANNLFETYQGDIDGYEYDLNK